MSSQVVEFLPEAATRTLETMFFSVPDAVSASPRRPTGDLIAATITFCGSHRGLFGLLVSEPLARTFAANFFGCDDDSGMGSGQVTGVMAELANMICGAALTQFDSGAALDLAAPRTFRLAATEASPGFISGSLSTCCLEFPEGTLVLHLSFSQK